MMSDYSAADQLQEIEAIRAHRRHSGAWSPALESLFRDSRRRAHRVPRAIMFAIQGLIIGGAPLYGESIFLIDPAHVGVIAAFLHLSGIAMLCLAMLLVIDPLSLAARLGQGVLVLGISAGSALLLYLSARGYLSYTANIATATLLSLVIFGGYERKRMLFVMALSFGLLIWISARFEPDLVNAARSFGTALAGVIALLAIFTLDALSRVAWIEGRYATLTAQIDPLTGLGTRGTFNQRFGTVLALAARESRPIAVMLLDLDHFKRLNDTHGHLFGDQVLREVGRLIVQRYARRPNDLRIRYGGEEILIVWDGLDRAAARQQAESLLEAIRGLNLHCPIQGVPVPVTASAGMVWQVPDASTQSHRILQRADELLYAAKRAGRDRLLDDADIWPLQDAARANGSTLLVGSVTS